MSDRCSLSFLAEPPPAPVPFDLGSPNFIMASGGAFLPIDHDGVPFGSISTTTTITKPDNQEYISVVPPYIYMATNTYVSGGGIKEYRFNNGGPYQYADRTEVNLFTEEEPSPYGALTSYISRALHSKDKIYFFFAQYDGDTRYYYIKVHNKDATFSFDRIIPITFSAVPTTQNYIYEVFFTSSGLIGIIVGNQSDTLPAYLELIDANGKSWHGGVLQPGSFDYNTPAGNFIVISGLNGTTDTVTTPYIAGHSLGDDVVTFGGFNRGTSVFTPGGPPAAGLFDLTLSDGEWSVGNKRSIVFPSLPTTFSIGSAIYRRMSAAIGGKWVFSMPVYSDGSNIPPEIVHVNTSGVVTARYQEYSSALLFQGVY